MYRELSFKKGDIVYIRREIDKNWFEGEHNATIGLLPANYVEVMLNCLTQKQKTNCTQLNCKTAKEITEINVS